MKKKKFKIEVSRMEMLEVFVSCLYFECAVLNRDDEEGMIEVIRSYRRMFNTLCNEENKDD